MEILLESKAAGKSFLKSANWKREPYEVIVVQYTSADISAITKPLKGNFILNKMRITKADEERLKGRFMLFDESKDALEKGTLIFETWKQQI